MIIFCRKCKAMDDESEREFGGFARKHKNCGNVWLLHCVEAMQYDDKTETYVKPKYELELLDPKNILPKKAFSFENLPEFLKVFIKQKLFTRNHDNNGEY